MTRRLQNREIDFEVVDGRLVRTVVRHGGGEYIHRCTRAVYEEVAHRLEEHAESGVTCDGLAAMANLPFSQVNVALEFVKERGVAVTRLRRNFPASKAAFEDVMVEFLYLAEVPAIEREA